MDGFFNWLSANRHFSKGSLSTLKRRVACLNKWLAGRNITYKLCQEYILHLREQGRANATINGYILLFKLYDDYSVFGGVEGTLSKDLKFFPKVQRLPTILSVEEIEAIINAKLPTKDFLNKMMRLSVWFLASTGCRIDEMASLTKEHLHIGIDVNYAQFVDTKTYLDRKCPIPPLLASELGEFTKDKKPDELVFTSSRGNKLVEQTYNPWLRAKVHEAGINKHVYAHAFRSSFIMEHLSCGTDVLSVMRLVGHKDPKTTLGYTKFDFEHDVKSASNHPLFAKNLSTQTLLKKVKDAIDKWPVLKDYRFSYREELRDNSLLFEIYVK